MWDSDEDRREREERLAREIARRREEGESLRPIEAPSGGRHLSSTFWGRTWCLHLAKFEVYAHRLRAGRKLLRDGKVLDLTLSPGEIHATVADHELFDTRVQIRPLDPEHWDAITRHAANQVDSMLDLLSGQLGEGLLQRLTDPDHGILPQPGEIRSVCDCPDHADPCAHAAAVLYGAGLLLDQDPARLFTLRRVDATDLIATASSGVATALDEEASSLKDTDLSELFGIDLESSSDQP